MNERGDSRVGGGVKLNKYSETMNERGDSRVDGGVKLNKYSETMNERGDNRGDGGVKLNKYSQISSVPFPSPSPSPVPSRIPVESMSRDFSRAKIGVFWDVVDCPIPHGHDPISVYKTVESTLESEGYRDETMEIKVYAENNNEISSELWREYLDAGVYYPRSYSVSGDTCARVNHMIRDILIWTLDHPEPSNVMVIAKTIVEDTKFRRVLEALISRDHNVIFVQPDLFSVGLLRPLVRTIWLWNNLFDEE